MKKFIRLWRCVYNPFRLQNLKDFFSIFAGFTGIILLLVTLGPLKLVPVVEITEHKKVIMVNLDKWLKQYDNRGAAGKKELIEVLRARGLNNLTTSNKNEGAHYLCVDPDFRHQRSKQSKDNDASDDSENLGLHYAKEQLGYAERRNWPSKHIALKKNDDLFKWLFLRYGLNESPHGDANWTRTIFPDDVVHDAIESIQDSRAKRFAYENLRDAWKTYTVLCIRNPTKMVLRNIKVVLNLRDNYPQVRLSDTMSRDGILLQQDYDEYKQLGIPLLIPDDPKFLIIETNNTFLSKDKIAVAYDLMERVNWETAKLLLCIAVLFSLGVILLESFCKVRNK